MIPHEPWRDQAPCKGRTTLFFPDPSLPLPTRLQLTAEAKSVCQRCPVRRECLDYALGRRIEDGVWGGCDEQDRRAALRQRRAG